MLESNERDKLIHVYCDVLFTLELCEFIVSQWSGAYWHVRKSQLITDSRARRPKTALRLGATRRET